jgi:hypothetical protein
MMMAENDAGKLVNTAYRGYRCQRSLPERRSLGGRKGILKVRVHHHTPLFCSSHVLILVA